jgi:hypothetical protein
VPLPKSQAPAKKRREGEAGIDLTHVDTWGFYLKLVFDSLAGFTGHPWWERSTEQIEAVAVPAARICREQLPAAAFDKMQKGQNIVALLVGLALLLGPPLLTEWKYYRAGSPPLAGSDDPGAGTGERPIEPPARVNPAPRGTFGSRSAPPPSNIG